MRETVSMFIFQAGSEMATVENVNKAWSICFSVDLIAIFSGINESWRFGAQKDLRWSGLRYCCPLQWKQSLYKIQFSCLYTTSTPFQSVFIQLRCGLFFFIFSRNFEENLQTALYFECSKIELHSTWKFAKSIWTCTDQVHRNANSR